MRGDRTMVEPIALRRRSWRSIALLAAAAAVVPVTVGAGVIHFVTVRQRALALAPALSTPTSLPLDAKTKSPTAAQGPAVDLGTAEDRPPPATRPPARPTSPRRDGPQLLLRQANQLRARRQWGAAARAYEETIRLYPNSPEAYSATVAAGLLRLDHLGDARGALRLLSSAIDTHPRGALSEEAQWGRIEAYRDVGDHAAETHALEEFMQTHPASLMAAQARERLHHLEGRDP